MFFLLRVAFWLTLALALLPAVSSQQSTPAPQVGAADAVVAAGAAVSDMSSFCDRQAEACVVGAQAAAAIGQRAQAGARMVYEFIQDRIAHGETGSVPERNATGGKTPAAHGSQTTLKPADLGPAWRNPGAGKEAQPGKEPKRPAA